MALVLGPTNQLILHWIDFNGKHSTTEFWIASSEVDPESGAALALSAACQAVSNSFLFNVEIKIYAVETTPGTPATGPYDRSADKLACVFRGSDGSPVTIQIGGPLQTVIASNRINGKPGAGDFTDFVEAFKNGALTAEGRTIVSLARSYRRRPPNRRQQ